jgi:hypothetical protein
MGTDVTNPATLDQLPPLLANLIFWLLIFSGSVAVVIIIIAGIRFIISGGEAKTVDTAKKSNDLCNLRAFARIFFLYDSKRYWLCYRNCLSGKHCQWN